MTAAWDWTGETLGRLQTFLSDRRLCDGPLRTRAIGDGHSNLTYLVTDGTHELVVRRPPPPPVPPGGHDVLREAKLIAAVHGTGVPVPEVLAVAQAGEVLDVPFYAMSYVSGIVATDETPEQLRTPAGRRGVAEALIDTLAALHAVDWRARGLEGFGRPEGFNARHLRRMRGLVADADGKTPEAFAPCAEWLAANVPPEAGDAILHNDFRLGNMMLAADPPARILAVLDWELATIGDPLLDVGYFLASYPEPGEPRTPTQDLGAASTEPGYPTRAELAERYAAAAGQDLSNLRWYTVMAMWKLAVLYEYAHRRGEDAYYADLALVQRFLAAAHREAGLDALALALQDSQET
jgi:aminoglycoside phosphotransferase (APT) family kinase protein